MSIGDFLGDLFGFDEPDAPVIPEVESPPERDADQEAIETAKRESRAKAAYFASTNSQQSGIEQLRKPTTGLNL